MQESRIQLSGIHIQQPNLNLNPITTQRLDTHSGNLGIRIEVADNNAVYSGGYQRIGTRRRTPVKTAGLKSYVHGGAASLISGIDQRVYFGVRLACIVVIAFANQIA